MSTPYSGAPSSGAQPNNQQYGPSNPHRPTAYPWYAKSKVAAGLFGIFLGAFGVHNFYLGYVGKALAQLLITVLSFGILSGVSAVWGLIEGILILVSVPGNPWHRDGRGMELRD